MDPKNNTTATPPTTVTPGAGTDASKDKATTEAKAEPVATGPKLVRIEAVQMIAYGDPKDPTFLAAGVQADVSEAVAAEFCDRRFSGGFSFGGERSEETATRHSTVRAKRVANG